MRIQFKNSRLARLLLSPVARVFLALALVVSVAGIGVFTYYYVKFARLINRKLSGDVFARTSKIYAAPQPYFVGQEATASELIARLRRAGYSENKTNRMGWFHEVPGGLEIFPGPDSYFQDEPALFRFSEGKTQKIVSLKDHSEQQRYDLEPELVTNLFDRAREKRRLVRFEDLPPDLVNALLAAEDKSFFQHSGIDYMRVIKVAYDDLRSGTKIAGASTLTMQLSREFFLNRERTWKRKLAETMITLQLERRLTKQQIFEFYVNQVNFGQRGSFSVNGIAEAALAYFGKDVKQLTLPEAAFLVGVIRGPSFYSPYRRPDRARERRNRILESMVRIGAISREQCEDAIKTPLKVIPAYVETGDAPYFVDLVREQLLERFAEKDLVSGSYRIYTTLDPDLQKAAGDAVRAGIQLVDEQLAKRKSKEKYPEPQAALVALDPHTGEVKALVGGRFYGASQLNRAVAMRQPGSSFKPFVYAAAFNSALDGARPLITPVTVVDDTPTTFVYDGGTYEPSNYRESFRGMVSARAALAHSLNVATVKIGEMAGFDKVVRLAREAGLKTPRATPSVALGSYEAAPLEIAGAYTIFANNGKRVDPFMVRLIKNMAGGVIEEHKTTEKQVLDPRVAFLMTRLLEGVIQNGTGAGVRARGFTAPAAGKTGTSHDGWFAGYTSNLLCVVWVGFDDNRELPLSGSQSALPIWTAFMKRAASHRQYRNMVPFAPPPGVSSVDIDPASNQAATPYCPERRTEVFIAGSEPVEPCGLHMLHVAGPAFPAGNPFGIGVRPPVPLPPGAAGTPAAAGSPPPGSPASPRATPGNGQPAAEPAEQEKKKRGFFGRIFGVFKGGEGDKEKKEKGQPQ